MLADEIRCPGCGAVAVVEVLVSDDDSPHAPAPGQSLAASWPDGEWLLGCSCGWTIEATPYRPTVRALLLAGDLVVGPGMAAALVGALDGLAGRVVALATTVARMSGELDEARAAIAGLVSLTGDEAESVAGAAWQAALDCIAEDES